MSLRKVLVALLLAGCSTTPVLVPGPTAEPVPGAKKAAVDEVAGVRVVVQGDAWKGSPRDLDHVLIPLKITIENRSDHAIKLSYALVSLRGQKGTTFSAIPPYQMSFVDGRWSSNYVSPLTPRFAYRGFWLAPYHDHLFYRTMPVWGGEFVFDPLYYDRYYAWPQTLPTEDMIEEAIPEGVLEAGGYVEGFVYFPKRARDATPAVFTFRVVDAKSATELGIIQVPMVRR